MLFQIHCVILCVKEGRKMTKKIIEKKYILRLIFLCAAVYFVSYLTRINYSAVLVEMIAESGLSKAALSAPLTGLAVTYGFGQLISGILGDKFAPEKLIFTGLLVTSGMNILMPFTESTLLMTVIWSINGFAQALMWPPIVKILTTHLRLEDYKSNVVYITFGSNLATVLMYLLSPLAITFLGWRSVFLIAAAFALFMAFIWIFRIKKAESHGEEIVSESSAAVVTKGGKLALPALAVGALGFIVIATIMQGILRDGISTWMPTYITDVFSLDSSISILSGVLLPIFSTFVVVLATKINLKLIRNEALCAAAFFVLCIVSNTVLCFTAQTSPVISVALLVVINAATHGVNLMYTTLVVPRFAKYGKTSFITGAINSATYIGSAVSMYGVALITEWFGWNGTMIAWCIIAVLGCLFCLPAAKLLKKMSE